MPMGAELTGKGSGRRFGINDTGKRGGIRSEDGLDMAPADQASTDDGDTNRLPGNGCFPSDCRLQIGFMAHSPQRNDGNFECDPD